MFLVFWCVFPRLGEFGPILVGFGALWRALEDFNRFWLNGHMDLPGAVLYGYTGKLRIHPIVTPAWDLRIWFSIHIGITGGPSLSY